MEPERQRVRMVERQLRRRGISDTRVLAAMGIVPREAFVPREQRGNAYCDGALALGHGQTISQPLMVAMSAEALHLRADHKVLEVGAGSGYQAAILGRLAAEVHAIEIIPDLAVRAQKTLASLGITNVQVHVGDGRLGWPEEAPFDAIVVAAASEHIPDSLGSQVRDGGRIVMPVGDRSGQALVAATRQGDSFEEESLCRCVFVPLVYGG